MESRTTEQPRKIVPPVYMLTSIVLMVVLDWLVPLGFQTGPIIWGFGACFISVGVALDIYCALLFKKADTGLVPFHPATAIVDTGPFKVTRNPMYVGMALIQFGVFVILGNPLVLVFLAAFIFIIQKRFIEGEERYMEEVFGDKYLAYKSRVRRWI